MFQKDLKTLLVKYKFFLISLFIFLVVLVILGLPFTKWAPYKDDFGNLFRSQAKSFTDFIDFFIHGDTESICSVDRSYPKQDFLSAYYRPVLFVYTFIQKHFFGFKWYYYYLFMIIIHAFNSVILFNLFRYFVDYLFAFIGALYFAFHPSLCNWLGWFGGLQYHMQLFLFLLTIIFIKKYLDTKKIFFYIVACLFFLTSMFSGEPPIVTPIWIMLAISFYFGSMLKGIKISLGFWFISFFYIFVKLYLYPFRLNVQKYSYYHTTIQDMLVNKFFNVITCVSDFLNLSFFYCSGQRLLKGLVITFLILVFAFLFFKNKQKSLLLFLLFSIGLFCWPVILIKYCNRYIYLVLPFFILFFLLCIKDLKFRNIVIISSLFLIIINATFLFARLKEQEFRLNASDKAFRNLVARVDIRKYNINFSNLPSNLFSEGLMQALFIYSGCSVSDYLNKSLKKGSVCVSWDYLHDKFRIQSESKL